jgi:hypothetical protein
MRLVLLGITLSVLMSCDSKPDFTPNPAYRSTRFPETRTVSEAKAWLRWRGSERVAFVRGYFIAYRRGVEQGCRLAPEITRPSVRDQACASEMEQLPSRVQSIFLDEEVTRYASAITTFYEDYPEDDDVPISYLIEELRFVGKSPVEIHNLLTARTR